MAERTATDKDGRTMKYVEYKGRLLPVAPSIAQKVENLQNMTVRSDDVLICGYPRSGTNWVWEVVTMLTSGVAENSKVSKLEYMLEYRDIPYIDKLPSPRILNSHLYMEHLPPGIDQGHCKLLYIYRNPKDVAVSMYHFIKSDLLSDYEGTWDAFFDLYLKGQVMYGSWFEYTKTWDKLLQTRNDIKAFPLCYEDLKTDFTENVRRLSQFLGVDRSDDFLAEVEMKCNFKNLKAAKDKCYDDEEKSFWRGGKPAYMRKGTVGDWKNTFTVAQSETWDQMMYSELKDVKLKFRYT